MSKNNIVSQYVEVPDIQTIRGIIVFLTFVVNIINFMVVYLFETLILKHTHWNNKMWIYIAILIMFNLTMLGISIMPKKCSKYFYLYTTLAIICTSIYFLYVANIIFILEFGESSIVYIVLSVVLYILIVVTVILNSIGIITKRKHKIINNRNTIIVAFLGAAIGVLFTKPDDLSQSNLPLALVLLVLSYCFSLFCSGFYKFYLSQKRT